MGAFTELDEREVMEVEGGNKFMIIYTNPKAAAKTLTSAAASTAAAAFTGGGVAGSAIWGGAALFAGVVNDIIDGNAHIVVMKYPAGAF